MIHAGSADQIRAGQRHLIVDRDLAVQQIVSRSVVSTEIMDILKAAGITTPDISILSDEFLAEVGTMDRPNLALEALRKLIAGEVRSRSRTNVVETRAFSERLNAAIARVQPRHPQSLSDPSLTSPCPPSNLG